ncbi:hypothetical protein KC955_03785 [Candidatus Saccharibacteria bacterium]|nr:hypothetical protein [Candidatus Saccharibacteria bacterium]
MMGMLLNGIMAKGATLEEVSALLDAAFHVDRFNPTTRPKFPSKQKTITVAGSGKKGQKTVNISSLASVVAACHGGITILKLCSPSTSSVTGSQDFFTILGGKVQESSEQIMKNTLETNLGFFPVEDVLPKFASMYSGWYFAPHAMSFALAGMACRYKTDYLFYGLAHPNVSLSVNTFRHYGYPQALVASSTQDGTHYIDEIISQCGVSMQGYRSLKNHSPRKSYFYVDNEVQPITTEPIQKIIGQLPDQDKNIIKGLSALCGNAPLAQQVAINTATIFVAAEMYGTFTEAYEKAQSIINSGAPIKKLRELIRVSGGDTKVLDDFLHNAKEYAINNK